MIVLGVDPGSYRTGWGLVERKGPKLRGIAAGVISCGRNKPLPDRLLTVHAGLTTVLQEHTPDEVAVEDIFFGKYAKAALVLGQARGVVILAARQQSLPIAEYPPAVIKRSVAGSGSAAKGQLGRIVGAILGWRDLPPEDATDALAIAITHANAALSRAPRP